MSRVTMYLPDGIRVSYRDDISVKEAKEEISKVFSSDDELIAICKDNGTTIVPRGKILTITIEEEQSDEKN